MADNSKHYDFNDAAIPHGVSYWARLVEIGMPAQCGQAVGRPGPKAGPGRFHRRLFKHLHESPGKCGKLRDGGIGVDLDKPCVFLGGAGKHAALVAPRRPKSAPTWVMIRFARPGVI